MYQCLSPYTPMTIKTAIKKDSFIQFKKEVIQNNYKFQHKPIGQGGYGTVFLTKLKQPPYSDRCVKVINKKLLRKPQILMNQINIMKQLDHPNIVKLYEAYEDTNHLYLVQDLCKGGQLFDRIAQQGRFNQERAKRIFKQMVKIVRYLHLQKICHRDLKAENFLFYQTDGDNIALIDFGLSFKWKTDMKSQLKINNQNKILGTSYYVSPQTIQKNYDQRCDIWSLGVLLHIMLTSTAPFLGDTDAEILNNIKTNCYQPCEQVLTLSPSLQDLLFKILSPVQKRISLVDILCHPWLNQKIQNQQQQIHLLDYLKIKKFSTFSKLKAIFLGYIASQLPQNQLKQIGQLFQQIDINNDGYLTVNQIQLSLKKQNINIQSKQLHVVLKALDMDRNGKISFNQFVAGYLDDHYCLQKDYVDFIFNIFAKSGNDKIYYLDFMQKIKQMGLQLPQRVVQEIMKQSDLNNDGAISYDQFVEAISK